MSYEFSSNHFQSKKKSEIDFIAIFNVTDPKYILICNLCKNY